VSGFAYGGRALERMTGNCVQGKGELACYLHPSFLGLAKTIHIYI